MGEYSFSVRGGRAPALTGSDAACAVYAVQFWVYLMWVDSANLPVFAKAKGWGDAMNPFVYVNYNTYVGFIIGEPCKQSCAVAQTRGVFVVRRQCLQQHLFLGCESSLDARDVCARRQRSDAGPGSARLGAALRCDVMRC